jgi:hypothetical protein
MLLCCVPARGSTLLEYSFQGTEDVFRGFASAWTADGIQAGRFKSSFADKPHAATVQGVGFRGIEWGMSAINTNREAIDNKWYFEFTVMPERRHRLNLSAIRFSAATGEGAMAADRWFITSSVEGHTTDRVIASGQVMPTGQAWPWPPQAFQEFEINLQGLPAFQNLSHPVTFRLHWSTINGVGEAEDRNLTVIEALQMFGEAIDARSLPRIDYPVAGFGAVGDGITDDGPAIRAAFAAAAAGPNPARVVFEPDATYRFAPHDDEFNQIQIRHTQDLIVEGNGSTLIINPENRAFLIWRSRDVVVRGFEVDFDPLPFTQGEVLSVDRQSGQFVFQIQAGYPDVDPPAYQVLRPDWDNAVFIDPETRRFTHNWLYPRTLDAVDGFPGRYRVTVVSGQEWKLDTVEPGQIFAMNRHADRLDGVDREKNDEQGFFYSIGSFTMVIRHSRNVRVEDFSLYAFAGRAWNVFDSDDVELNRVRIMRRPGTDRAVSGVRGGIIMKELRGGPLIRNSHVEASMDDTMNRSDTPCHIESLHGFEATLRFAGNKWGDAIIAMGDTVEFWDRVNSRSLGTATVLETIRDSHRNHRMRFDRIPGGVITSEMQSRDEATLVYRVVDQPFIVRDTFFGTQLKKAIILRLPAEITDSYFEHSNYGIHAYSITDAAEGPYPRNQVFRNLTFYNVGIGAIVLFKPGSPDGVEDQNILIDNVHVYHDGSAVTPAHGITISGINGATVMNSVIQFGRDVAPSQELLRVQRSLDVTTSGNVLIDERLPWTDSNGDGIPDWWKMAWFGTLDVAAHQDYDSDGSTNLQEFLAGTNPRDPQSVFRAALSGATVDRLHLAWSSAFGRVYTVQESSAPGGQPWTDLITVGGTPPVNSLSIPWDSGRQRTFIRMVTRAPGDE